MTDANTFDSTGFAQGVERAKGHRFADMEPGRRPDTSDPFDYQGTTPEEPDAEAEAAAEAERRAQFQTGQDRARRGRRTPFGYVTTTQH